MTGRLRAVPDRPLRMIGYIRVSDEGGRGDALLSPELQLTAIRDHCARQGHELTMVLEDIDRTGRLWKRRKIEQAVQLIEAGTADGIVVWKLSRITRDRKDWALAVDRVEGAGGLLESATEHLDASTSTGRFTRGMLAELAAFESELIGENWKGVHKHRTDAGLPHYGPARLGYSYHRTAYVVDEDQAAIVRELYARYTAGEGLGTLADWLLVEGVTGARGKPWSRFGVGYYLKSGFAAGQLYHHDPGCRCGKKGGSCGNRIHKPGAHPAIITPEQWAAYERARADRATIAPRSRVPVSRLAGVVICAGCDRPMQLQGANSIPRAAYVCRTTRLTVTTCPAPAWARRDVCETASREWLERIADEFDSGIDDQAAAPVAQSRRDRLARRIVESDEALGRLTADLARRLVPEAAYEMARDELVAERTAAQAEFDRLAVPDLSGVPAAARSLLDVWETAKPHETARAVRDLLRVQVIRGQEPAVFGVWEVQERS